MVNGAVDGCGAVAIKERQQFVELRLRLWWHRNGVTIHQITWLESVARYERASV